MKCPCCQGSGVIPDQAPVHLSPLQLRIYDIVRKHRYGISGPMLADRVYADREDGGPDSAKVSICVQIVRANKRLVPAGQKITCGNGKLYRLERDVV